MFCTACGTPITPEQAVCSKCGSPTSVGLMYGARARRVAEHIQLLGILHIVYSALICIPGIIAVFIGKVFFGWFLQFAPHNPPPPPFVGMIIVFVGWLMLIRGVIGIIAGVGLLQRAPWARILALIMGFLSLISFPFGTALGIYTIWVLMASGAEEEYNRHSLLPH